MTQITNKVGAIRDYSGKKILNEWPFFSWNQFQLLTPKYELKICFIKAAYFKFNIWERAVEQSEKCLVSKRKPFDNFA